MAVDGNTGRKIFALLRRRIFHFNHPRIVWSFILRYRGDLRERKSTSQEETRLEVPRAFLHETMYYLREHVQGMKTELVIDFDEVGMSERGDRKDNNVIISKTMTGGTIDHGASRNVKHVSTITCITATGESLTPYIVISQDSEPFRKRLMSRGVRLGIDFVLRQRCKPYVNNTLFLGDVNSTFIHYLNEL
jgi:hypothetical protein